MKPSWYNSRAASSAPLVLFVLLFITYASSLYFLAGCGGRLSIAGCEGLSGAKAGELARLDKRPVLKEAFKPVDRHGITRVDKSLERKRTKDDEVRRSALEVVVTRLERRIVWSFFSGLSVLLSVVGLVTASLIARAAPDLRWMHERGRVLLVLLPATAACVLLTAYPEAQGSLMNPILKGTVATERTLGMASLPMAMAFMNALGSAVAIALALGAWLLTRPRPEHLANRRAATAEELRKQLEPVRNASIWFRVLLYVGTATLVSGVLRMNSTISWMQSFLTAGDEVILDSLRVTLVGVMGTFYTLVLACLYLPAVFILRARARGLIEASAVPQEVSTAALQETDFSTSLKDVLPKVAALLGPVLAGPVGEFLKNLSG